MERRVGLARIGVGKKWKDWRYAVRGLVESTVCVYGNTEERNGKRTA